MPKISICIPTRKGTHKDDMYLRELFSSISEQTFNDYEVCLSDQSKDDSFLKICEEYSDLFLIRYYKNDNDDGGPSNTNSSIEMAEGEIIKIIFQDDFFYSPTSLHEIYDEFKKTDSMWLVSGCNHVNGTSLNGFYNYMTPKWNKDIIKGVNTISSPSVLSIRSSVIERFDSNVPHLMDCEYYYNLYEKYGEPIYINNVHITNRVHETQHSHLYVNDPEYKNKFNEEVEYCLKKHNLAINK